MPVAKVFSGAPGLTGDSARGSRACVDLFGWPWVLTQRGRDSSDNQPEPPSQPRPLLQPAAETTLTASWNPLSDC
ncbi:hypothetical protein GCM10010109_15600 [Actinoplanes campanulatus]|nr:hypothetical protein GCM10010109_15600 [Actinoplanes campanulatus]